jgi:outer membrane protein assembly factor BamB
VGSHGNFPQAGLLAALLLALGAPCAWPQAQFRGDAARNGVLPSFLPNGVPAVAVPAALPAVRWRFATGGRVVSSPVLAEGRLHVGSDDGQLYALDATSGRLLWAWPTDGPVPSTPAVAAGRVHVLSYDGRVHTLDARSGAPLWMFATGGERRFEARGLHGNRPRTQTFADVYDVFLSSPAVVDGVVYVGSSDGHLYALDAASGALRWKQPSGDVVHASPAVAGGLVVVGSWDGKLYAFDAASGAPRWQFQAGVDRLMANQQGFQSSPAIADGVVYVGCRDSHLYAIDLATGRERWRFSTGSSWVVGSPAVSAGKVVFATSDSSRIHIVQASDGKPLHELQAKAYMFSSPTIAGDTVLIGVLDGTVLAFGLHDGRERWIWRSPASQANRGWVLGADGRFNTPWIFQGGWREDMALGFERQSSIGSIFSTPLVAGGRVFVGSADGWVYALE